MTEKEFIEICKLDEIAEEAGGYVACHPTDENEVHYN